MIRAQRGVCSGNSSTYKANVRSQRNPLLLVVPLVNLKQSAVRFRSPVSGTGREDFKHDCVKGSPETLLVTHNLSEGERHPRQMTCTTSSRRQSRTRIRSTPLDDTIATCFGSGDSIMRIIW